MELNQIDTELDKLINRVRRNTLGDLLTRTSERYPDKNAIAYKNERLTYKELDNLVNKTANGFLNIGIKKGDKFILVSKNSLDFVLVTYALARIGAVLIPVNYMLTFQEIRYILENSKAVGVMASDEFRDVLVAAAEAKKLKHYIALEVEQTEEALADPWIAINQIQSHQSSTIPEIEIHDDDLAHILYTSGTESKPKGVMLTHKSIVSEYVSTIIDCKMESHDIAIHALPLYHSAQLHVFLGPNIYIGSSGVILPSASPESILETIEKEQVTQLFCPPTVWIGLLRHPDFNKRDLSSLKKGYYGAAIMPMEIIKELTERLPQIELWNCYGQTEVAPLATVLQPKDQLRKLGSAGLPSLNVQTKIVDEDGIEVARGIVGEIVHRTPHSMTGYLYATEKTKEAFKHGWFHSGDLGFMDEEGYITIVDRKKDMIITGGVNVSSREVEEVIYEIDGVSEVAVISVPDPYWGEAVTAIIVLKEENTVTKQQVIEYCSSRLSKFKTPKYLDFTDVLPKNPSGKVLKRSLRNHYEDVDLSPL